MDQTSPSVVVEFMENIKAAEARDMTKVEKKTKKSSSNTKSEKSSTKSSSGSENKKKATPYYCKLHGANYTHDTEDCRASKRSGDSKKSPHKTWTKKATENSEDTKKEIAAIVAKELKSVKKQLAAVVKKRKASTESSNDGYLAETLASTKDLDGFNYETMDTMDSGTANDAIDVDVDSDGDPVMNEVDC